MNDKDSNPVSYMSVGTTRVQPPRVLYAFVESKQTYCANELLNKAVITKINIPFFIFL
jgi:hypothetical protein